MANKTLLLIFTLIACTLIFTPNSYSGTPSKKLKKELYKSLQSTKPKKVNKCLDKIIKINYYTGIMQIRQHARRMLKLERSKIVRANRVTKKNIQKKLVPWVNIDKKTIECFKNKNINQKGKENPLYLYQQ